MRDWHRGSDSRIHFGCGNLRSLRDPESVDPGSGFNIVQHWASRRCYAKVFSMAHRLASTFDEMADLIAAEDPTALVLGWWCRLEQALNYCTIAYHGRRMRTAAGALEVLESDGRLGPTTIQRIHLLRRTRNVIAHGKVSYLSPQEAKKFAADAWELGWLVGSTVPNELAISSGAAKQRD